MSKRAMSGFKRYQQKNQATVILISEKQYNECCKGCPYVSSLGKHECCYKEEYDECKSAKSWYFSN